MRREDRGGDEEEEEEEERRTETNVPFPLQEGMGSHRGSLRLPEHQALLSPNTSRNNVFPWSESAYHTLSVFFYSFTLSLPLTIIFVSLSLLPYNNRSMVIEYDDEHGGNVYRSWSDFIIGSAVNWSFISCGAPFFLLMFTFGWGRTSFLLYTVVPIIFVLQVGFLLVFALSHVCHYAVPVGLISIVPTNHLLTITNVIVSVILMRRRDRSLSARSIYALLAMAFVVVSMGYGFMWSADWFDTDPPLIHKALFRILAFPAFAEVCVIFVRVCAWAMNEVPINHRAIVVLPVMALVAFFSRYFLVSVSNTEWATYVTLLFVGLQEFVGRATALQRRIWWERAKLAFFRGWHSGSWSEGVMRWHTSAGDAESLILKNQDHLELHGHIIHMANLMELIAVVMVPFMNWAFQYTSAFDSIYRGQNPVNPGLIVLSVLVQLVVELIVDFVCYKREGRFLHLSPASNMYVWERRHPRWWLAHFFFNVIFVLYALCLNNLCIGMKAKSFCDGYDPHDPTQSYPD